MVSKSTVMAAAMVANVEELQDVSSVVTSVEAHQEEVLEEVHQDMVSYRKCIFICKNIRIFFSTDYNDGQNGDMVDDQQRNDNYRPRPRFPRGGSRGVGGRGGGGPRPSHRGKGPKDNQQVQNTVTESTA